ncbi:O-antigen ligase domain-containing protein [Bradyrhizobium sp. LHD-71]|uniref:O-antigen ligase family protein n=1 Tax=Bradyrhizobium sp. LHD-71 TaxID=3072141 RepID=UPI00280D41D0|nr:O-antigen ligase domain-containing protein [Bradyrhizobium sp. LHD-71]MDQ8729364.1 O-antigen ligase domain-containing protein [Bradyrhizobium sp. LHD-71]
MTYLAGTDRTDLQSPHVTQGIAALQRKFFWLIGAAGAIVFIEPSPFELAMIMAFIVMIVTGLRLPRAAFPLIVLLVGLNIGYSVSAIQVMEKPEVIYWILTSWYMALACTFFALTLVDDTAGRLDALSRGYLFGALIAAVAAIVGYFHLIPGTEELLTYAGRAKGTFKDPNVLGAFLVYPAVYCVQRIVDSSFWPAFRSACALLILSLANFLAFSRGAWAVFVGSAMLAVILMYITAPTNRQRVRIILLASLSIALGVIAIIALLSSDQVASLFEERASLTQSYDVGRFGRFGRHLLGAEMALDYPFGIGPLQFARFFTEHTHNSFLNAFMSGGWLSGLIYLILIATTLLLGTRAVLQPTPWRNLYIIVFSTFVVTTFESFIIDVDHWRHYYMLLGLVWGISIASARYTMRRRAGLAP